MYACKLQRTSNFTSLVLMQQREHTALLFSVFFVFSISSPTGSNILGGCNEQATPVHAAQTAHDVAQHLGDCRPCACLVKPQLASAHQLHGLLHEPPPLPPLRVSASVPPPSAHTTILRLRCSPMPQPLANGQLGLCYGLAMTFAPKELRVH